MHTFNVLRAALSCVQHIVSTRYFIWHETKTMEMKSLKTIVHQAYYGLMGKSCNLVLGCHSTTNSSDDNLGGRKTPCVRSLPHARLKPGDTEFHGERADKVFTKHVQ
jgi:hypothetical protein